VKLHGLLDIHRAGTLSWFKQHGLPDNVTVIMIGRHWNMLRKLYERAAVDYPMVTSWWLTGLGRSSVDFMQVLTEEVTGEHLAKCVFRGVAFDINTQKSVPFEGRPREQALSEIVEGDRFPALQPPSTIPSNTFSCTVRVRHDDADYLLHATQSAYVAFARECASQATAAGFYSKVIGDFAFYVVESLTSMHAAESFAGDDLKVTTFEDPSNPLHLFFVIYKEEQPVCYTKMLLFDRDILSSKL